MSLGRSSLIFLSRNRRLRHFAESNPIGRRISDRFVAGITSDEAIETVATLHAEGLYTTLDRLGETVLTTKAALAAKDAYGEMLDLLAARGLAPNVSVKLSQMGIEFDPSLAEWIMSGLVMHAKSVNGFVRIDMEDSKFTEATIAMTERLNAQFGNDLVGTVIQAYLYRSESDVKRLIRQGIRIRLCKGAYRESAAVAFPRKADVDEAYFKLATMMLSSGIYHGFASHDEALIDRIVTFTKERQISRSAFEFQMLYGVRRDLQRRLAQRGFRVRVYVPFGEEWFPYFMRRLAERPANLFFLAKNLLRT
jgi:proline dehydrogenase